jgi:hypothetical protein
MGQWADLRIASEDDVVAFDQVCLREPPYDLLEVLELETPFVRRLKRPRFVVDLSDKDRNLPIPQLQTIHGSYLVRRQDVLLFGPSNVVSREGYWTCENREGKGGYLSYMQMPFYQKLFPGDAPQLHDIHTRPRLGTAYLTEKKAVRCIDEPVFLATPLEPPIWGRWVSNVMPRVRHFLRHGQGRKFLCHVDRPWERRTLNELGVRDDQIIPHEPGRTYLCRDIMLVEDAGRMLSLSLAERAIMNDIVSHNRIDSSFGKKLFVARVATTRKNPNYRPLLNETEMIDFISKKGFSIIEPDLLPLREQVSAFRNADVVVFVGGSAIYNTAFCQPGTRVVTMESSMTFLPTHMEYLSALDMEYGIILGQEDPTDDRAHHKRWSVDVEKAWYAIESLLAGTSD